MEAIIESNVDHFTKLLARLNERIKRSPSALAFVTGFRLGRLIDRVVKAHTPAIRELRAFSAHIDEYRDPEKRLTDLIHTAIDAANLTSEICLMAQRLQRPAGSWKRIAALADDWEALLQDLYIQSSPEAQRELAEMEGADPEDIADVRAVLAGRVSMEYEPLITLEELRRQLYLS